MNEFWLAFRWYLVVQLFGLAALPLCLRLLRYLPDRGYGVSKPLGLVLGGWLFWTMATFDWVPNRPISVLIALGLLAFLGWLMTTADRAASDGPSTGEWLRERWPVVVVTEGVFLLAFAGWCLVRARMPRIETAGGEKWMEIAFLRAILRSETFPPHDPWLSGFAISYYYFGYVMVAMITQVADVLPSIGFNLGIATLFALVCTAAYSLVYNLVAARLRGLEGEEGRSPARLALGGGLLGPVLVAVMGNLEGLMEVLHARGLGPAGFWRWLDINSIDGPPPALAEGSWVPRRFFWWWQASRVLQDYYPTGGEQHVIDEFPGFSFLLGDMHPHVLALPFVLLAVALALNLYLRVARGEGRVGVGRARRAGRWSWFGRVGQVVGFNLAAVGADFPLQWWGGLVYALCLGGLGFLNTWDFPIYLFVVVVAYGLAYLPGWHDGTRWTGLTSRPVDLLVRLAGGFGGLLVAGVLLYVPFWAGFRSQAGGLLLNLFNATRWVQFLVMFGPLLFLAFAILIDMARRHRVSALNVVKGTLAVKLGILLILAVAVVGVVVLVGAGVVRGQGALTYVAAWVHGGDIPGMEDVPNAHAVVVDRLLARLANPWVALALIGMLVLVWLLLRGMAGVAADLPAGGTGSRSRLVVPVFVLCLLATGALLTLGVEYVYLRDNFGIRMNTVFKFYFQAWVLWAVAGAYGLVDFVRRGRVGVTVVAGLLILAGLLYPALAIPARAGEYGGPPTLDGAAYLADSHPEDYAAIDWLNQEVEGAPVILEAPGSGHKAYVYEGRVSAHTGLPTLLGWAGHENQWRGSYEEQARREPDIETLYTSTDVGRVQNLMDVYDVTYVYVGPLERERYPQVGLDKFGQFMEIVYQTDSVTIYRR